MTCGTCKVIILGPWYEVTISNRLDPRTGPAQKKKMQGVLCQTCWRAGASRMAINFSIDDRANVQHVHIRALRHESAAQDQPESGGG